MRYIVFMDDMSKKHDKEDKTSGKMYAQWVDGFEKVELLMKQSNYVGFVPKSRYLKR